MFIPELVAFDVETALLDGTPSVEFYRHDFRVTSAAFSWFDAKGGIKSKYLEGEEAILNMLRYLVQYNVPIVVHNYQFEYGVTLYRFPGINLNWHADTMRLTQVWDNGGKKAQKSQHDKSLDDLLEIGEEEDKKKGPSSGLSLQSSASRVLTSEYHDHKAPYYQYIRDQGIKKGHEGANLHLLPSDMMEKYNTADTEITLRLYHTIVNNFKGIGYDWTFDHYLYMFGARLIAESKGRGILVDREALATNLKAAEADLAEVLARFRERFRDEIGALEQEYLERIVRKCSTERGQVSAWETAIERGTYLFKPNSGHHKKDLFVGKLGINPKFKTKTGRPAFGKAFLSQWGEGGLLLEKRGALLIGIKQMSSLLALSEYDGRYHVDLRAAGAATGRFKGGA